MTLQDFFPLKFPIFHVHSQSTSQSDSSPLSVICCGIEEPMQLQRLQRRTLRDLYASLANPNPGRGVLLELELGLSCTGGCRIIS